jgi:hypothetical protein
MEDLLEKHIENTRKKSFVPYSPYFSFFSTELNRSDEQWTHDEYTRFYNFLWSELEGEYKMDGALRIEDHFRHDSIE